MSSVGDAAQPRPHNEESAAKFGRDLFGVQLEVSWKARVGTVATVSLPEYLVLHIETCTRVYPNNKECGRNGRHKPAGRLRYIPHPRKG